MLQRAENPLLSPQQFPVLEDMRVTRVIKTNMLGEGISNSLPASRLVEVQVLILFVKVPRPGDSEVIFSVFKSSYSLLLPV